MGRLLAARVAHGDPMNGAVATLGLALVILGVMEVSGADLAAFFACQPIAILGIRTPGACG